MAEKTSDRYILERRIRELKKDLSFAKSRPPTAFSKPFSKKSYIAQMTNKLKKLERRKK